LRSKTRELVELSSSEVSGVAASDGGVGVVGGALEFVVEGGDPGEESVKCCSFWESCVSG
jgi:hypothetical protein